MKSETLKRFTLKQRMKEETQPEKRAIIRGILGDGGSTCLDIVLTTMPLPKAIRADLQPVQPSVFTPTASTAATFNRYKI